MQVTEQVPDRIQIPSGQVSLRQNRFLIVEDDVLAKDIWEQVISTVYPSAVISWVRTEEGAEMQIRNHLKAGTTFDLVIVDIFLAGKNTGIELWKRYGGDSMRFLFTSVISPSQFAQMIGDEGTDYRLPAFVSKPLALSQCIEGVRGTLYEADESYESYDSDDLTDI
jgi:hypothetical protein